MSLEDPLSFVVATFSFLEDQLLDCMEYVPYIEQNKGVVSPKFIPILMEACSLIDSVFRYATDGARRHTLKGYASVHEERLELEEATTLLLVSPLQFLRPFRAWQITVPPWWDAYNRVKHDRIKNYAAASYTQTVTALAGLHQVLARSWPFLGHLTQAGWFNESDDNFLELCAARAAGAGPPEMPVQTKLFVSSIRGDFVDWSCDPPRVEPWDFTPRVKNHILEWEGL